MVYSLYIAPFWQVILWRYVLTNSVYRILYTNSCGHGHDQPPYLVDSLFFFFYIVFIKNYSRNVAELFKTSISFDFI